MGGRVRSSQREIDFSRYRYLRVEIEGGIASVRVRRPEYDARGHWEICEVFRDLELDTRVKSTLFYWADPPETYDTEGDIYAAPSLDSAERYALYAQGFKETRDGIYSIIQSTKPIVSALRGEVPLGPGMAAAILADISIAGEGSSICDNHVSFGIPAGDQAVFWVGHIGLQRARRLLLACEPITGAEAARIGLVSLAVPDDHVLEVARGYAAKLAGQPRNALRLTKQSLNQYLKQAALVSFDFSMAVEHLGLLDGDTDAIVAAGRGPKDVLGESDGDPGELELPSDQFGDRSYPD
jgi:enoyl-CoA hydratase